VAKKASSPFIVFVHASKVDGYAHTILLVKKKIDVKAIGRVTANKFADAFHAAVGKAKKANPEEWYDSQVYDILLKEGWEFELFNPYQVMS
jgi:hypothetical protein